MTRVLVGLLAWWSCGVSYAVTTVDFPSLPLQTGAAQPAPNVVFILDDSRSMEGDVLDSGLKWANTTASLGDGAGAPYTKNPLSYNPATTYSPWASANSTDTSVVRLDNADYGAVCSDDVRLTSCSTNLNTTVQRFYVPKDATLNDQTKYWRYEIRNGTKLVRAEWSNVNNSGLSASWGSQTANANNWNNGGGNGTQSNSVTQYIDIDISAIGAVSSLVIGTGGSLGTNRNPNIYVKRVNLGAAAAKPCRDPGCTIGWSAATQGSNTHETLTINNPVSGRYYIGVWNSGSQNITGMTVTATATLAASTTETSLGCTVSTSSGGWKNCADITSTGDSLVGALAATKANYANWYEYHRTRMKVAKAGGSEAFAKLDENFRVGLMGLYPSGTYQQVFKAPTGGAAPTDSDPGNLKNMIPVDTKGGLFTGSNRKDWFDHFHGMVAKNTTPLRKALDGAGKYFSSNVAYKSVVDGTTSYLACRQNFAILTTDGYWNNYGGSASKPAQGDDPDGPYAALSGDDVAGELIKGPSGQTFKYEPAKPYVYSTDTKDTSTLADVAMHYWKTDLLKKDVSTSYPGSAENRVPSSAANPAFWQHMVTFGVGLGVRGTMTDAQVVKATSGTGSWPAPVHAFGAEDNPVNVDDLRHAAFNSRGAYINANDADEFSRGITEALNRIGERRGSASNVLANSTSISTDSFVYQATYTSGSWRGELLAYPISAAGLGAAQWRASERVPAWGSRKIFTADTTGGSTFPSPTQLSALGTSATALGLSGGSALANYLKGDASNEKRNSGVLRDRVMRNSSDQVIPALLGDIVDSSPFYVADNQTIFVGANDGMLHAFDGTSTTSGGAERFAYVPKGVVMAELADLADPLYASNDTTQPHRYFVDGPVVVSARTRTPGKNYLVGGLGRGGRGVYGLDVTNPSTFAVANVLWDNTGSAAPANMGNVISEPLISRLNGGTTAAVVANGPNSSTGTASLFIINLTTGATIAELDTSTTGNGLSAPRAVDTNADGAVDLFFAGDLLGNLWRFDVSSEDPAEWEKTASITKVITATDGTNAQPISSAPGVARDPNTGKIWVFFGTGRFMTEKDQASTDTYSYYGVIVGNDGKAGVDLKRGDLQEREIHVVESATGYRAFQPSEPLDTSKQGWVLDLDNPPGTGERVISAPIIYDNVLIFSSIVPPAASTVNSCDAGGTGYVNALDAFSGTSLTDPFFDEPDPTILDKEGKELPIGSIGIISGMPTAPIIIGDLLVVGDSSGGPPQDTPVNAPGGSSTRRVMWREILNEL